ncbi:MAG: heme ABC exporter ATP-binding protein CcmA [Pontixanthobacter sp.]
MQPCRLTAHDLACRRGDRILFHKVAMDLTQGDALRIAGPNGVGKSSLMRILAGLLRPFGGTVDRKGAVGLMDERTALDPQLPLGRALAFWNAMDGDPPAQDTVELLEIADLWDVPVRYLSTGQQKRAGFARLIGQNAPIWLLDEPLNGLDSGIQARIVERIANHRASGGIVVVASHQPIDIGQHVCIDLTDFAP